MIRVEVTEPCCSTIPRWSSAHCRNFARPASRSRSTISDGLFSLSYLHQFPLQALKIDRSFVAELTASSSSGSNAVVRAILALAGSLGMQVIAEGIENEMQREQLLRLGCEIGQGFFFGEPQPAEPLARPDRLASRFSFVSCAFAPRGFARATERMRSRSRDRARLLQCALPNQRERRCRLPSFSPPC